MATVTRVGALALRRQGGAVTVATLREWRRDDWRVVESWLPWALLAAAGLLASVYGVAELSPPDPAATYSPAVAERGSPADAADVLGRNCLVLALHALACVAGFIAGSSLPRHARRYKGAWRTLHERAGPVAILVVVCATAFSLLTQAATLLTVSIAIPVLVLTAAVETFVTPHLLAALAG